jgi:aminomethyltransferase
MTPLVEVIQDTCGRHDSFLLACTDTYYEDAGYPGHASCTTNFNLNLASYAIRARRGWPAVNFFYNTEVGDDGTIAGGESWARPGDYVLLRACRDLLCATSSCADDIDPANGWDPTPIHVRVYDADCTFPRASGVRAGRNLPMRLTRETAFTPRLRSLTDHFTEVGGTWLPEAFAHHGEHAEYWALRERAATMDLSALRKFEVSGSDSGTLLQWAFSRDVAKIAIGQSAYGCLLTPHGGILDDGLVFHLGENAYRYVGNGDGDGEWLRRLAAEHDWDVLVKSSSDHWHNLAVQGPLALDVLKPLVSFDLAGLGYFRFANGCVADIPALVSRTGYTGERGYELFVHPQHGAALWDALLDAGQAFGMLPLGMKALDRARIEAGLLAPCREFDSSTSPFQAGIGWAVAMRKPDFLGKAALAQIQEHPYQVAVGLVLEGNEVAPLGKHVYPCDCDFPAGTITSATFSPVLSRSIALAQVFPEYAEHGTQLEVGFVDGMARRVPATVGPLSAYDPQKTRVKA